MTLKTTKDQMLAVYNGKRYRFVSTFDTTCAGCPFDDGFSCSIPRDDRACHPLFGRQDGHDGRWKEVK
jgi:hypothetical protein